MDKQTLSLEGVVVAGLVMAANECLSHAFELGLDEHCFTESKYRDVFNSILECYNKYDEVPDEIMIMDYLMTSDYWDTKMNLTWNELQQAEAPEINFKHYCRSLIEKTYKRLLRASYEPFRAITEKTSDEELNKIQTKHYNLSADCEKYNIDAKLESDTAIGELKQEAEMSMEGKEPESACSMDFLKGFDETMTPIQRGEYVVIGGRPSEGKSSIATNCGLCNLKRERTVFYYALESNVKEVTRQMSAQHASVNWRELSRFDQEKQDKYNAALDRFGQLLNTKLFVSKNPELGAMKRFLDIQVLRGNKPDVIIVDYIQLIRAGSISDSRSTQIGYASRELKDWAGRYNCVVIALAQLSRAHVKDKGDRLPGLPDLRESGDIEADAVRALLLHRYRENNHGAIKKVKLIQAKQRFGPLANMELRFDGDLTRFYVAKSDQEKNW